MKLFRASVNDAKAIQNIVHTTISHTYSKYYPSGVVKFFLEYHSQENIIKDIKSGEVLLIEQDGELVATGSLYKNEIKRVFVLPDYQGLGCGGLIMDELERLIVKNCYDEAILQASLPAYGIYLNRGYKSIGYEQLKVFNDEILFFHVMRRALIDPEKFEINYNNRMFRMVANSEEGQTDANTVFSYRQDKSLVWAKYHGGQILKGFLLGTTHQDGRLYFAYQHLDTKGRLSAGLCRATPEAISRYRIRLKVSWERNTPDRAKGVAVLEQFD